jgi:hypothetical protein
LSEHAPSGTLHQNPPFPDIETLAVRDFHATRSCGLDDAVLTCFAASPSTTTLKRLVLRHCNALSGDTLVAAVRALRDKAASDTPHIELEISGCSGVQHDHAVAMQDLGVHVKWETRMEDLFESEKRAENSWWDHHHELVQQIWEYTEQDWEKEAVRDESPWWRADVNSRDPKDRWVF